MDKLFLVVLLALVVCSALAFDDNEDDGELSRSKRHGRRRCWWWGRCKPKCDKYDKDTEVCCRPYSNGECCRKGHLHDLPKCNSSVVSYHSYPCDCAKFYQCLSGNLTLFNCPIGGAWNQDELECVKVTNRRPDFCGKRPYRAMIHALVYANYNFSVVNNSGSESIPIVSFEDLAPKDSAFNVMAYFAGTRNDFSFTASYNKRFWYFIDCINDLCSNFAADGTYWMFKINGVASKVGVSSVILKNNDVVRFELVKSPGH